MDIFLLLFYCISESYNDLRAGTSLAALQHNSPYIYTPASSQSQTQHQQRMSSPYHQAGSPSMSYHELIHSGSLSPKVEGMTPPSSRSPVVMSGSPTGFELNSPHIVLGTNNNNNNSKIVIGNGDTIVHTNMDRPTVVSLSS